MNKSRKKSYLISAATLALIFLLLLLVFMLFSLLRYGVMFWGMLRSAKKR